MISSNLTAKGCGYCDYKVEYVRNSCLLGCGTYTQRYYHIPLDWIDFTSGINMIVLFEEIGGDPSSVKLIELGPSTECGNGTEISKFAASAYVRCQPGTFIRQVNFASFGTVPQGMCGSLSLPGCSAQNATQIVKDACLGRTYCQIPVSTALFGDPCPGILYSLYIEVQCS